MYYIKVKYQLCESLGDSTETTRLQQTFVVVINPGKKWMREERNDLVLMEGKAMILGWTAVCIDQLEVERTEQSLKTLKHRH